MKSLKNDRSSYKSRSLIGNPKPLAPASSVKGTDRNDFAVDSNGYFIWRKPASMSRKCR
jgi:hypothetical protein